MRERDDIAVLEGRRGNGHQLVAPNPRSIAIVGNRGLQIRQVLPGQAREKIVATRLLAMTACAQFGEHILALGRLASISLRRRYRLCD